VLGAFILAAFVKGPQSFTDIPSQWALPVIGLVLVGALAAAAAIYTAALAAQSSPLGSPSWTAGSSSPCISNWGGMPPGC
jgi:hypothetical protein